MIKVSDHVLSYISHDDIALEALRSGILNLSAYADKIRPEIEKRSYKPVRTNTITVALSRIAKNAAAVPTLKPYVKIETLNLAAPLIDITLEKTQLIHQKLLNFVSGNQNLNKFIAITSGIREVNLIIPEELQTKFNQTFTQEPKSIIKNLVGITVSFSDTYISIPNTIYTLLASLAARRINILEVVSTYSEISFIIKQQELDNALTCLKPYLSSS